MLRRRSKTSTGKYRLYCNLGYNLSEEVVRRYFQQICTQGQILDVYIPRHNSGRNKGYGFATFEKEADLFDALQSSEHVIEGNVVKINRAGPRPDYDRNALQQGQQQVLQASAHGKGPRLYVGGIPDDVHEDDIKNHFERWGDVVDIYFPGKSGLKRVNYCFVTFDTWQAAQLSCTQSERSIARKPIQSISLAEERTADARDAGHANLFAEASRLHPTGIQGLSDWSQQYSDLGLRQYSDSLRDQRSLPHLSHQEVYPRMEAQQGLETGELDRSFREQILLHAMQQRQAGLKAQSEHSQSGLAGYSPLNAPRMTHQQPHSHLEGYAAGEDVRLLQQNPGLGREGGRDVQASQQARNIEQMHPYPSGYGAPEQFEAQQGQQQPGHAAAAPLAQALHHLSLLSPTGRAKTDNAGDYFGLHQG